MTERHEFETVIYELDPPVARIILNRPERANTQSSALIRDVERALRQAEADYTIKVVILKANGKGFCAGHALEGGAFPEASDARQAGHPSKWQSDLFLWPILHVWEFEKPLISQVHGYAIGGGTYLALLPDIVVASEDAYFQMPLVQGLGLPGGHTMIEPWVFMNFHRAFEYLYLAQTLTAQQALDMGLVNRVVPRPQLEDTVESIARQIAEAPLSTLMSTKALVKRAWELMGLRVHWQASADLAALASLAADAQAWRDSRLSIPTGRRPRQVVAEQTPDRPD